MNERIQQLAEQAEDEVVADHRGDEFHKAFTEKFAELIVQECVLHLQCRGVEGFNEYEEENLLANFGLEIE